MKKYEAYKGSGVNWIGLIPREWNLIPIKYSDETIMGQSPSSNDYLLEEIPDAIPFLQGNAEFGKLNPKARLWCNEANKHSKKNDILISVRAPIGAINISDKIYGIGRGLSAVRGVKHTYKFLYYYLHFANEFLNVQGTGSTFTAISTSVLKELLIPNISSNEQTQISNYLDHKTQIIDALIEKKQQLIKKLQEQRQAIINEAVTKGLNPNAKLKDSGIEWLGRYNSDWHLKRIKHITYVKGRIGWQGLRSEDFREVGPYLVTGTDFEKGKIKWKTCHRVDFDRYEIDPNIQLLEDDVLITKDGTIGKIAIVKDKPNKVTLNTGVFVTRPLKKDYLQDYFFWLLSSDVFNLFIDFNKSGATIQHLYQNVFNEFSFALPSNLKEQQDIVEYLESKTIKLDLLTEKIKIQIKNLKSYRQSIISEAVTGKIDVRDWQAPTKN